MTLNLPAAFVDAQAVQTADPGLLDRIMRHDLDRTDVSLPFSRRLARENGWTDDYAARVIKEYKKFVYLTCISPREELTPSDEVDQAWHLHLVYSRDYWGEFCPRVLGKELHHGPTEGGPVEAQKFERNYLRTLELYHRIFGEKPPSDIWPPPSIRFAAPEKFRRVNLRLFSLKPRRNPDRRSARFEGLLFAAVFVSVLTFMLTRQTVSPLGVIWATLFWTAILYVTARIMFSVADKIYRNRFSNPDKTITQQQHGFTITYTVGVGVATVYSVEVSGTGDSDARDSGSDGGGDAGCGGGGCGGGGGGD